MALAVPPSAKRRLCQMPSALAVVESVFIGIAMAFSFERAVACARGDVAIDPSLLHCAG